MGKEGEGHGARKVWLQEVVPPQPSTEGSSRPAEPFFLCKMAVTMSTSCRGWWSRDATLKWCTQKGAWNSVAWIPGKPCGPESPNLLKRKNVICPIRIAGNTGPNIFFLFLLLNWNVNLGADSSLWALVSHRWDEVGESWTSLSPTKWIVCVLEITKF